VSTCAGDELGRWWDRAADDGLVGGWLWVVIGNNLRTVVGQRTESSTRPPSIGFGWGVLQPVTGVSFNWQWASPSTGDGRGLLQLATGQEVSSFKVMAAHGRCQAGPPPSSDDSSRAAAGGRQWRWWAGGSGGGWADDGGSVGTTGKCGRM
jgi:hypothetical protein